MSRRLIIGMLAVILAGAMLLTGQAGSQAQTPSPGTAVLVPPIPDPVAVSLDPKATAYLAMDFTPSGCNATRRPACIASLPAVNSGAAAARSAGVPVIYTYTTGNSVMPEITSSPADTMLQTSGADKFFKTNLDDMLKALGVTTLVLTGTASNGAVLYTAFQASSLGYTVVVAEDGISADTVAGSEQPRRVEPAKYAPPSQGSHTKPDGPHFL
jgi:hypothetical protein